MNAKENSPLRVLALVTEAFGGHGGIAQYNRDFLSALAESDGVGGVIVLPRSAEGRPITPSRVQQLVPVQDRVRYVFASLSAVKNHRPNVIFCGHCFMAPLAAMIARFRGIPLWIQVHGVEAWDQLPSVYRRALEGATLITSVSRYSRRRLLQWVGIDPRRVKVLPNTVGAEFRPGRKPEMLMDRYSVRGKKVLMTVSRLASEEKYKGHDRVIRALPGVLSKHNEAIYVIVGDGDDRPRIEALVQTSGLTDKVRFAGRVAPEELPDHYRLADLLVMPSTGEGFGIVFLEAMATGIPVIGGDRDGSMDPLADGVLGSIINPEKSENELASAICSILADPPNVDSSRFNSESFNMHIRALISSYIVVG